MKEQLTLNLKNMMQRYYDSKADNKVWDSFFVMYSMDFISYNTWMKFFEKCKDWVWDEEKHCVITMFEEKIVKI